MATRRMVETRLRASEPRRDDRRSIDICAMYDEKRVYITTETDGRPAQRNKQTN